MKLRERLNFGLLRIPNVCEGCGQAFACEVGLKGCWCSQVKLSEQTLKALKAKYSRCVCRACLERAETETQRSALQD